MKKIMLIALSALTGLCLFGCAGKYKIKVIQHEDMIFKCPSSANPGDVVHVETAVVTDADLYLNSTDDTKIEKVRDGEFKSIMPDHDIELKITVISNGGA